MQRFEQSRTPVVTRRLVTLRGVGPHTGTGRAERRGGTRAVNTSQGRGGGEGGRTDSEAALDERVAQQEVCSGTALLLHKHLPQEVPASV